MVTSVESPSLADTSHSATCEQQASNRRSSVTLCHKHHNALTASITGCKLELDENTLKMAALNYDSSFCLAGLPLQSNSSLDGSSNMQFKPPSILTMERVHVSGICTSDAIREHTYPSDDELAEQAHILGWSKTHDQHLHFNVCTPCEPRLATSSLGFLPLLFSDTEPSGTYRDTGFYGGDALSVIQPMVLNHFRKFKALTSNQITHLPHPFFFYHRTGLLYATSQTSKPGSKIYVPNIFPLQHLADRETDTQTYS